MISSYRLGDLVLLGLGDDDKDEILRDFPNSIGSEYILEKRTNVDIDNIELITKIVVARLETNFDFLPKDIGNSTIIHLRIGDVVRGTEWHEVIKRPFSLDYIQSLLPNNEDKIYVMGKCFFAKTSSANHDDCISSSSEYLQNIINGLNCHYFDGGDADIDLCCAVKSKCFIQGRGFYSKLILEIRKRLNLQNIETMVHD